MISLREGLARLGGPISQPASYAQFWSRPTSLRAAIRSTIAPASSDWRLTEIKLTTTSWTNQCQGVAFDGEHWIFSGNSWTGWGRSKGLWAFRDESRLHDSDADWALPFPSKFNDAFGSVEVHHVGQLAYADNVLYVSHFNNDGRQILVFDKGDRTYHYRNHVSIGPVQSPRSHREGVPEFQTINPWDGMFYTTFGDGTIDEFFIHDQQGRWTGRVLPLDPPIEPPADPGVVQGACFSPNGHLYVSSNTHPNGNEDFQCIRYYSALTGRELGVIRILAQRASQELEGICYANGGLRAVLLDVFAATEADDMFFKRLTTNAPEFD